MHEFFTELLFQNLGASIEIVRMKKLVSATPVFQTYLLGINVHHSKVHFVFCAEERTAQPQFDDRGDDL